MVTENIPKLKRSEKKPNKATYQKLKRQGKRAKLKLHINVENDLSLYKDRDRLTQFLSGLNSKYAVLEDKKDKFRKQQLVQQEQLEKVFNQLVEQWKKETRGISSSTDLILHPAYQQIIGMGKDVIPLLLRELEKKSGRWFWALKSITRQDPVPPEKKGKTKAMINIWLDWGRKNGYQW